MRGIPPVGVWGSDRGLGSSFTPRHLGVRGRRVLVLRIECLGLEFGLCVLPSCSCGWFRVQGLGFGFRGYTSPPWFAWVLRLAWSVECLGIRVWVNSGLGVGG